MIRINNYLHREDFSHIIKRWMYGQLHPEDGELITHMVHFNSVFISRTLSRFSHDLFSVLHHDGFYEQRALYKRDLKDAIVLNPPYTNARIEEMIASYRSRPEDYYGDTPFQATLFFQSIEANQFYVGSYRIKRVRRLAEKCARRIIDRIFEAIQAQATQLANDRAKKLGVPREQLITTPEDMRKEFIKAESRIIDELRNQKPVYFENGLEINDVAGIKVILEKDNLSRLVDLLEGKLSCTVVEQEEHRGPYNAINLIVEHTPKKEMLLIQPLGNRILKLFEKRGLEPEKANREFANFVHGGESKVRIEIIVSNYQEMLEGEIGRCMHEDRIMRQRLEQEYQGNLVRNIEYLMLYLFNYAVSPHKTLQEIPIKLWNRYLPDTFDEIIRTMFDIPALRVVE